MQNNLSRSPNPKIAKLKIHLENLFPGQWINSSQRTKTLSTGLAFIDQSISRGLARQKISAWIGPASCGKTSLLRSVISRWLNCGFEIAYIDTQNKLLASNWIHLENIEVQKANANQNPSKFWVVRNLPEKDYIWATETLIKSRLFDVIIFDIDLNDQNKSSKRKSWQSTKVYSRLQNALSKSKTALLFITNANYLPDHWHFYSRLDFQWAKNMRYIEGLNGKALLLPSVHCSISKNGISNTTELPITTQATNHLFTHSSIADRRPGQK